MTPTAMRTHDWRLAADGRHLFARSWHPSDDPCHAPVLLFHDSLGCVELWRDFPQVLAEKTGRTIVAYDRPGFGRSDPHPGRLERDFVKLESRRTIPLLQRELGFARFIACGHSIGGGMAVEAAAHHRENCIALVTMGAQAFVEDVTRNGIILARKEFERPENMARLERYHGSKAGWVLDAWTTTWLSPDFADWTLDAAIGHRACPALVIHGELDQYGSSEHPRRIAGRAGHVEILGGIGHVPHREATAHVAGLIARFLAGIPVLDR